LYITHIRDPYPNPPLNCVKINGGYQEEAVLRYIINEDRTMKGNER